MIVRSFPYKVDGMEIAVLNVISVLKLDLLQNEGK